LDAALPVTFQGSLRDVTSLAFLPAKAAAVILGALGLLAIAIAFGSIYGLAAYSVSARRKEIGIRVAVGSGSTQVLGAILGRVGTILVAGGAAGVGLAIATAPLLSMVVYQASSRDARTLIIGAVAMVLIGLTAAWMPARRALKIDPAVTLRES
jgi:ABC-type antimicrobial peptide transport system permease subunit